MRDDYVFPRTTAIGGQAPGMELRDLFAGMVLSGLVVKFWGESHEHLDNSNYAEAAYNLADEMIAKRKEGKN